MQQRIGGTEKQIDDLQLQVDNVKSLVDAVSDRCSVLPIIDKEFGKQSIEDQEKILILVTDMEKMSTALDKLQEHVEDLKTWYQRDRAKGDMPIKEMDEMNQEDLSLSYQGDDNRIGTATYNEAGLDTFETLGYTGMLPSLETISDVEVASDQLSFNETNDEEEMQSPTRKWKGNQSPISDDEDSVAPLICNDVTEEQSFSTVGKPRRKRKKIKSESGSIL